MSFLVQKSNRTVNEKIPTATVQLFFLSQSKNKCLGQILARASTEITVMGIFLCASWYQSHRHTRSSAVAYICLHHHIVKDLYS